MKVNLTAEMKKFITVAEMPAVKKVMQYEKENDEWTVQEWAKMAARLVFDDNGAKVIEATARIEFTAFSEYRSSFIIAGVYLTDLWQLTKDNADEIKSHMYIRRFEEVG